MCSITRRRVSGSSFPSRNEASGSSEGKPVCSICSTVLPQSDRRSRSVPEAPVTGVRGPPWWLFLPYQAEGDVLIAVEEEVVDVGAGDAGLLQGHLQADQQLVDAFVEFFHVEREDTGDVGDAHGVGEEHAQDDLVFGVEAGDGLVEGGGGAAGGALALGAHNALRRPPTVGVGLRAN